MQNMRDLPTIIIYCTPGTGPSINYQTRLHPKSSKTKQCDLI